ncbi:MAG TPA: nucleoside diphosphate kinase regulator [Haliea salexigens]|uniref:Nucleoside diphosphate kinase regulator n=1 Tax=Haliea salexigens TaxID=287487 RepID=A0A3C1KPP7_9GAMM|nr:nucleoside diphosphate kinase regulator [Haliea sp.]HAN28689.1 nucleoside diphosphate kinase regulator [Haliea salexigens]HAN68017.1 nucleoside diphosphate kinase regulator [Halieaceae bacterium]HBX71674.1 nucleoside diphosphate kinase regulator [Halieaceae bacterium]|tara:strand:+ start:1492 stop:1881 length:390 start_codon:yes stop_codon:yes gene_type:complete
MMLNASPITVKDSDYRRLLAAIEHNDGVMADALDEELARAETVPDDQLPSGTVSMHSRVTFQDIDTGSDTTVTLVYPQEANVTEMKISVLTPVGSALIGLAIGGEIEWPLPTGGARRLRIKGVDTSAGR